MDRLLTMKKARQKRSITQKSKNLSKKEDALDLKTFLAQSIEKLFLLILQSPPSPLPTNHTTVHRTNSSDMF